MALKKILFLLFITKNAYSASCCGGGASLPNLISGDQKYIITQTMSQAKIIGFTDTRGNSVFRSSDNSDIIRRMVLGGSYLLSDYHQIGITLPFTQKEKNLNGQKSASQGLGDISLSYIYEFLPETSYSAYRPRGFTYSKLTLPTAPSLYDSTVDYQLDARGSGFWVFSQGVALLKNKRSFDFQLTAEAHYSFKQSFNGVSVQRDMGGSFSAGVGYSLLSPVHLGVTLSPQYEGAKTITTATGTSRSSYEMVWDSSVAISFKPKNISWNLSFSDQTLLGPARNTDLLRTFALGFTYFKDL